VADGGDVAAAIPGPRAPRPGARLIGHRPHRRRQRLPVRARRQDRGGAARVAGDVPLALGAVRHQQRPCLEASGHAQPDVPGRRQVLHLQADEHLEMSYMWPPRGRQSPYMGFIQPAT
jgi:hypothetical protein